MSPVEFLLALMQLHSKYPFNETSGHRTPAYNHLEGGVANSPHLYWVGRDVIFEGKPLRTALIEAGRRLGLTIIQEGDHHHIQPATWIAG